MTEQIEYFSKKVTRLELELEAIDYARQEIDQVRDAIEKREAGAALRYQDIQELQHRLKAQHAAGHIDNRKLMRETMLLEYQAVVKRRHNLQQKKEQTVQAYHSGAHMAKLPYEQIADFLGCSSGTVASRINRAKKALAKALKIPL